MCLCAGDAKSDETANKEAGEEKPEEDNDYHRSDEQVRETSSCCPPVIGGMLDRRTSGQVKPCRARTPQQGRAAAFIQKEDPTAESGD